ncbi:MAG: hypothetical protein Q7S26_00050 [bacterium]|nr:hypothetical protein [bacterium]
MPNLEEGPSIENVPEGLVSAIREKMGSELKRVPETEQIILIKLAAQDLNEQILAAYKRAKEKRDAVRGPASLTVNLDKEGRVLGRENEDEFGKAA